MADDIIPGGVAAADGWIGTGRSDGVIHPGLAGPDPLLPAADFA